MHALRFILLLIGIALLAFGYRRRKQARAQGNAGRAGLVLLGLGAVLSGLALFGFVAAAVRGPGILEGQCIAFGDNGQGVGQINVVDCAAPNSLLQVGLRVTGNQECPAVRAPEGVDDAAYYRINKQQTASSGLCILPNLRQGACYSQNDDGSKIFLVDCAGSDPRAFRVQKRVDGSADPKACEGVSEVFLAYPAPPRVYCMGPAR